MRIFLALMLFIAWWPQTARSAEFDHEGLARQTLERHIRPGYEQLFIASKKLRTTIETFCSAPPGSDLTSVKDAFEDALLAWFRIEYVRFGPIMSKARHARMVFWPDRQGIGRKQVARALRKRDESVLARETLQKKSVALQGFGAMEYILFANGSDPFSRAGPARKHRCGFMRAISASITHISREVLEQWSDGGEYAVMFLHPGANNAVYLDSKEVTFEIARTFIAGLAKVRDIRIAGPLGLQRKGRRRKRASFERSGLSMRAITANLEGLIALYEQGGLMERIGAFEAGMEKVIQNELVQSLMELRSIALPMKEAVASPETKDKLMAIGFPLRNAHMLASHILADAAGLSLGFNALDGD